MQMAGEEVPLWAVWYGECTVDNSRGYKKGYFKEWAGVWVLKWFSVVVRAC